ncbi:ABC transporter substrate-binding protein [Microbacterium arabinogalactanolyticum]|uniref:ABC transporter substrate-binding protein n=1 Tax=Microbacterium arabinogalactanolyticum TaxID=69365 RepID=UPI0025540781|nr:ABC transporter substrate-binding protein [Microbacterium arabinogalactanolyticum]GLC86495.1 ABC transporter substrate-binding protein [Microbacterium arabinogalactanolyticum]
MKRRILKAGAVIATLGIGMTMLAGCTASGEDDPSKPTKITMLVLGDKPTNGRLEAMLKKLNANLKKQANATLDLFYVEWADWQTQYNVQLLSGDDKVDLITTATDWLFGWENAEKGAFLPLSEDMLKANAPKTWAQVEKSGDWDLTKLDGKIQFIPEDDYTQYTNHGFFYRGDWAKEAGFADGTISTFEDFTKYFQWIKKNKPEAYPWDVASTGGNDAVLTGYLQGHTDQMPLQGVSAGNYAPFTTSESDPGEVTSWYMEGDELEKAAELAKEWNRLGVWREDALNYDGDTREEFYSGLSGTDQHHTQTFIGQIWNNMTTKQPGSEPKMFYWGQENGNLYKDIKTHGAMAVSANSKHPEKALQVYDLIRNDKADYDLLNFGIEGTDYVMKDGKLGYPEGYDASKDSLGSNFWAGRMDEFEPAKVTDDPDRDKIYGALDKVARDYPYSTLIIDKSSIDPTLAAMGAVLSEYIPQLNYGKFDDPAKAIKEMRQKLKDAGYEDVRASLQKDVDAWAKDHPLK